MGPHLGVARQCMQDRAIRTYVDRSDVLDLTETLPVYQLLCKGIEGQRTPHQRRELFRETMCRHRMKMAVFVEHQVPDCRTAKAVRLVENCIEHRGKNAGGGIVGPLHPGGAGCSCPTI